MYLLRTRRFYVEFVLFREIKIVKLLTIEFSGKKELNQTETTDYDNRYRLLDLMT